MSAANILTSALLVSGVTGWMWLLRIYQRPDASGRSPHPEWVRKLMHVAGGLLALGLPFVFSEPAPVVFTCVIAALLLVTVRTSRTLRQGIGAVLGSVGRHSLGEVWFPISVAFLFVASERDTLMYSIPLLILIFADAAAALVGTRYGQRRYSNGADTKTLEGSLAFFVVALAATGLPLILFGWQPAGKVVVCALLLALTLTLVEAACRYGLDNLLVPIAGFYLLRLFLALDATALVLCLAACTSLLALFPLRQAHVSYGPACGAPDAT